MDIAKVANPAGQDGAARDEHMDDLQRLIRKVEAERPGVREAREDLRAMHAILDELVSRRKALQMSQGELAERIGVKQPTVSQFETESSDPKLSTLQRYARAVGARLCAYLAEADETWQTGCASVSPGRSVDYAYSSYRTLIMTPSTYVEQRPPLALHRGHDEHLVEPFGTIISATAAAAEESRTDFALGA